MRLKLIACKALSRELSYILALSKNTVDVTWLRQKYHDTPEILHKVLQQEIDAVESEEDIHTNKLGFAADGEKDDFEAILLGYGLCSNAILGLTAKKHKLVIPKAHDCITLLLGSKERYKECFHSMPGCFWYTASWVENSDVPGEEYRKKQEAYYKAKGYEDEVLEGLMEEVDGWTDNYESAAYIQMPFFDGEEYQNYAKCAAKYYNWDFHLVEGKISLMERFVAGDWNKEDFLVLEPGETAEFSLEDDVIKKAD